MKKILNKTILLLPILAAVILYFSSAVSNIDDGMGIEGKKQLEDTLRRTAAACYAAEGVYPPSVEYMTEHYGIKIDDRYTVMYDVIASNLMPDITVLDDFDE